MKICLLELQPFPYNMGGGTVHLINLSKYLIRKGHEVSIITSKPENGQKPLQTDPKLKIYNVGLPHKNFYKTNFVKTLFNLGYRFLWEGIWILAATKKVKEINADIYHPQSLITTALPCSLAGKKFVSVQHGVHLAGFRKLWGERQSKVAVVLSKIYELFESYNAKKAKTIICTGGNTFDYYKRFGKNKCVLLTPGIDIDEFKGIGFEKKKDYLFMGRLTEQKGLEYLISALEILDKKGVKITFNIAGEGEKEYVSPLVNKTKNFKNIKVNFLGNVTGKKKIELYKKTRVFVSSSVFEPFGIVIVENMASGIPIISANHEGARTILKPAFGTIIPFEKKEDRAKNLANAILRSLKWNTNKMGLAAIKESKKYSYDNIADKTIRIFKRAL